MTTVRIDLNADQAKCFREHSCFATFFSEESEIPVGHPVKPFFNDEEQAGAVVVAIQEARMRLEDGGIKDGFIFIFVAEKMEVRPVDLSASMIIPNEAVKSYQKYGYFALPFVGEDDLAIGGIMKLTNSGLDLEPGIVVAVQKFMATWRHLFIIAKPPK